MTKAKNDDQKRQYCVIDERGDLVVKVALSLVYRLDVYDRVPEETRCRDIGEARALALAAARAEPGRNFYLLAPVERLCAEVPKPVIIPVNVTMLKAGV